MSSEESADSALRDAGKNHRDRSLDLGLEAYAGDDVSNADLLQNLVGRQVDRFAEGTGEHAGTALMAVELSKGDELGVQVSMAVETSEMTVYPNVRERSDDDWVCESYREQRSLGRIKELCPLQIVGVAERNIMDPDEAEVIAIVDADDTEPFAINIYHDDQGRTEFFEL